MDNFKKKVTEKIPSNIEVFGYRNVNISQEVTDKHLDKEGLNYSLFRVQVDLDSPLIIDLGHGRQIRIRFHANKSTIS